MKTNYSAEIAHTIKVYEAYRKECKKLENIALCKLKNTIPSWHYEFMVHCSYIHGDGLSFTIDTGYEDLTTSCTQFFKLFNDKSYGDIILEDIKNICY